MNYKKIFKPVAGGIIGLLLGFSQSCNYLEIDQYINDLPTLDSVFQRRETTMEYLANVYSFLPDGGATQESPWVPVSDECLCTYQDGSAYFNYFSNNNMSAYSGYFDRWAHYYQGIRNASVFLKRVSECQELTPIQLKEFIGEAHFLRAYFYFELMKEYGPVPLAPDGGYPLDTQMEQLLVPRNTWDECVDFVTEDLKMAAGNLPQDRPSTDFGKPTKGAAYAVMSRLLLYSASPLFNGNTSYSDFSDPKTGEAYINPAYDDSKWAKAAWAALQVIETGNYELYHVAADALTPELPATMSEADKADFPDGAGGIDPYKSYSQLFNGAVLASDNSEVIFGRPSSKIIEWVQQMAPYYMGDKGSASYNITQKLVDAYYMADGYSSENASQEYPCDKSVYSDEINFSGYKIPVGTNGWYLNREARFYATVGFCNSYYYGISTTGDMKNFACGFYYDDEYNGKRIVQSSSSTTDKYCMTGYLCRKFLHNEDNFQKNGIVRHKIWIDYRLAEIYLNYAEALNELKGAHTVNNVSISREPALIQKYFNLVRHRAGLPGVSLTDAGNYEKMKTLISRERQIELAWEGHRYFDVRRWKIADKEENEPIYGVDINKSYDNRDQFYQKVAVREKAYTYKSFSRRQNFWPIPNDEIVRNPNLVQSPGW